MSEPAASSRRRGSVRQRGNSLQVRVFAGVDPVTGKDVYLTVQGTDKAAQRKAEKALTRLLSQVDAQRTATSSVPFGYAINEWLRTAELEESTREMYRGYVDRSIRPVLGDVSVRKISARMLENLYAELRRCRVRCDRKPFIEHRARASTTA